MTTIRHDTAEEREYVLGTNDAELTRLGFQHQVWSTDTTACWERAGFRRGATILDVGCGPGYATFDLADLVGPEGRVVAVDVSQRFVAHLRQQAAVRGVANIEARVEDLATLDRPPESVDGAFARWVMCFLPDPAAVIARVARALRPGASLAIMDYSHYEGFRVAPPSRAVERVFAVVADSFRAHGGNPNVGMDLPAHLTAAGLEVRGIRPLVRVGRPGTALWEWPRTFFQVFLPTQVAAGTLTAAEHAAFWEAFDAATFFTSPPMVEVIATKGAGGR
jgi:SAM-dependent methyltransferase